MNKPKSIRSCGNPLHIPSDKMSDTETLYNSWDYWERQGMPHPMKGKLSFIKPLTPVLGSKDNVR